MTGLGLSLFAIGSATAAWGFVQATSRRRPGALVGAVMAPTGVLIALIGAVLTVVPGFLG